ncbi:hypothetical protein B0H66DRAFT_540180 [Apodospora peruviana]|uniref:STB6-like N-terminal domain-containing protein n=1 Tax=Apodospora peruviana TaxID=516989 RepID=A0AAE0ME00_9PEZI|nr:hypothetical protein B0H66DRAFT_540180 [Apodospora peruviana]
MSIRMPFPGAALDARVHREEQLTLARTNSQLNARRAMLDTSIPPKSVGPRLNSATVASKDGSPDVSLTQKRRRVVLPDPVALKFLEDDSSVTVVERKRVLQGYELYLVEQWACSRQSPALVIATYTGDPKHSIVVGVLEVPEEEKEWSRRLGVYFKAIQQYHARPKETEIGELMVTNLSSFPSALTVIAVPDGDIRKHRQIFIVNEDLKRLGCSGRSGLTLSDPTPATQAKFLQLYKTSDKIPFFQSVLELIKLCQMALFIFGLLDQEYIDGLLCDLTETAINNWWTEIGSEYFNIEPTDGILGPTTIAALLGTLMGARNRLSYYGAPVGKDVFDIDNTKRGIGTFQKSQKIEKTRRLDRQTLLKLHSVTAKAAQGDGGWGVQKAVKSTVAEIGGKRGELVIGMVGGRDKANIGDIETTDLDKFINLAYGERAKWLWHGKARRTLQDLDEQSVPPFKKEFKEDEPSQPGSRRTQSLPLEEELETRKKEESPGAYSAPPGSASSIPDSAGDRDALRKAVFKSVAGKVNDARSGLGRIRDAVGGGRRGHASRPSKDENMDSALSGYSTPSITALAQSSAALTSPVAVGRAFTWKTRPEEYLKDLREREASESAPTLSTTHEDRQTPIPAVKGEQESRGTRNEVGRPMEAQIMEIRNELINRNISGPASLVDEGDLQGPILTAERSSNVPFSFLQRRHSVHGSGYPLACELNEARYPRRISFSDAEDAILRWREIIDITDLDGSDPSNTMALQNQAELARSLYARLLAMQMELGPWVTAKLSSVETLDETFSAQQSDLQSLYLAVSEAYQRIQHNSGELVAEERARLSEAVRDVEVLVAKLEYEIGALVGRVQDVEDGIKQFEAQVADVERRADELKAVLETESWLHWFVRTLTGIGTGPNITRGEMGWGDRKREEAAR